MAAHSLFIWLILSIVNIASSHSVSSQKCLSSPPEYQWTEKDGDFYGTITYDAKTFTINNVTFTTRVMNQEIPSPTMRMIPGKKYYIDIINNLGPEKTGIINTIKELNYTTLHIHGIHISGEDPADNVWAVVNPGESITAIYEIPCFHSGGTFWYHPHHHGSNAIQIGGGGAGALIMEPNEYEATAFPRWYEALYKSEIILVIQWLSLAEIANLGSVDNIRVEFKITTHDELFHTSNDTEFYVINGEYQPSICVKTNIWTKLRIAHVNIEDTAVFKIIDPDDSCSLYLLSKDGVLIHGIDNSVPREIPSKEMHFTVASRADVAVRCTKAGTYPIEALIVDMEYGPQVNDTTIIGYIEVTDSKIRKKRGDDALLSDVNALTTFNPLRPKYLQSLVFYDGYMDNLTVNFDVLVSEMEDTGLNKRIFNFTVNGKEFAGENDYMFETDINTVQEWTIRQIDEFHPYHQHINHFQFIENCNDHPSGWSEVGDWIDTIDFDTTFRFITSTFGGGMVVHCHVLRHSDFGMMSVVHVNGGCDGLLQGCDYEPDMCEKQGLDLWSSYNWASEASEYIEPECPVITTSSSAPDISMVAFGDDTMMEQNGYSGLMVFILAVVGCTLGTIVVAVGYYYCVRNKNTKKYESMRRDEKEDDIDDDNHKDEEAEGDEGNVMINTGDNE